MSVFVSALVHQSKQSHKNNLFVLRCLLAIIGSVILCQYCRRQKVCHQKIQPNSSQMRLQ